MECSDDIFSVLFYTTQVTLTLVHYFSFTYVLLEKVNILFLIKLFCKLLKHILLVPFCGSMSFSPVRCVWSDTTDWAVRKKGKSAKALDLKI
ncbi:hypothetical protein GMOD_00010415 [Pyrenophora seminiperda CCB06]|uniref:Uncharacterized protein n=1 Tax=Pyrenophora seminiperda CCB06 TaxID=1302712 RepID=A0A3M7LZU5_9PLEO|nr:hypothetical protein GMOD_00010415 [Pyrenophora seminiperda CCB06]